MEWYVSYSSILVKYLKTKSWNSKINVVINPAKVVNNATETPSFNFPMIWEVSVKPNAEYIMMQNPTTVPNNPKVVRLELMYFTIFCI